MNTHILSQSLITIFCRESKKKGSTHFGLDSLMQQNDELNATYYARIREITMAKRRSHTDENDTTRDHIMKTMQNNAIYNNLTLLEILDEAAISEHAQLQAREIKQKFKATETRQIVKYTKYDSHRYRCQHDKRRSPTYEVRRGKLNHFAINLQMASRMNYQ